MRKRQNRADESRGAHGRDLRPDANRDDTISPLGNRAISDLLREPNRLRAVPPGPSALVSRAAAKYRSPRQSTTPQHPSNLRVSRDTDQAYRQQAIFYRTHDTDTTAIPKMETGWGSHVLDDDSYFKDLINGPTRFSIGRERGVGHMTLAEAFVDWRDTLYLNEQFIPEIKEARIRWEQRSGEERLTNVTGTLDYNPDGGGGMQVNVLYHYGGYVEEGGYKKGQHNLLLNFTYDSKKTQSQGIEFGGEFGGKSGKAAAKASSSVSVGKAALSFSREIAFESYSIS